MKYYCIYAAKKLLIPSSHMKGEKIEDNISRT